MELFCCGRALAGPGDEEVLALDTGRGRYRKLRELAQVSERTGAATGCGGCRPDVARILEAAGAGR